MSKAFDADGDERRDAVFRALSDPTRRAILDALSEGERCVNDIAAPFSMSQPAVSQHLKALGDAGLVGWRRDGRRSFYRLEPGPLRDAYEWLAHYQRFWPERLDALGAYLDDQADHAKRASKKGKRR